MAAALTLKPEWLLGLGLAAAFLFYARLRGDADDSLAEAAGKVAGGALADASAGIIKGVGAAVGIPDTNTDRCSRALADGRYWDASFDCPAADFIAGVWGSVRTPGFNPDVTGVPAIPPELQRHPDYAGGGASGSW